jgi:hypothetical protein
MGIPGVNLVTTEFADAAHAQCDALALEAAVVWVPHPIQNRTPEELRALAAQCVDAVIERLTPSA